ncbi:MAG: GNAT family N-acetyltransferase [Gammaproteobacteria bacterium]|nr:GNAT family N-acetyltransferase [Gammaproteobacteria bacterium]
MRELRYLKGYPSFSFILASWEKAEADIRKVRNEVFVDEQNIPMELEWDGMDKECLHVMAYDKHGLPIGTGRIRIDSITDEVSGDAHRIGQIGRLAVAKHWRSFGVGGAILVYLIHIGEARRLDSLFLNAQEHLQGFYENRLFVREGGVFDDAGIPHVRMARALKPGAISH